LRHFVCGPGTARIRFLVGNRLDAGRLGRRARGQGETLHLEGDVERFEDAALVGRWVHDSESSTFYELRVAGKALVGTRNGEEIVLIPCS